MDINMNGSMNGSMNSDINADTGPTISVIFDDAILPELIIALLPEAADPVVFATFWSLALVNHHTASAIARNCVAICTTAARRCEYGSDKQAISCVRSILPNGLQYGRQIDLMGSSTYRIIDVSLSAETVLFTVDVRAHWIYATWYINGNTIGMTFYALVDIDMLLRADIHEMIERALQFTITSADASIYVEVRDITKEVGYISDLECGDSKVIYDRVRELLALITTLEIPDSLIYDCKPEHVD
jgi:hypothetical protein